eukprot:g3485.t1
MSSPAVWAASATTAAPGGALDSGYLWMPIVAGFAMFYMAWGIGANDVANAFATSFGARSITMKQAVVIATFCEFLGALALGSQVSATIRKGIVTVDYFPGINGRLTIMCGMMSALLASALWLHFASMWALPVSTTHTIIGGVIGFVVVSRGYGAVTWSKILEIVASWLVSPLLACAFAGLLWYGVRGFVYARGIGAEARVRRAQLAVPPLTCLTWTIVIVFMVYKGAKGLNLKSTPLGTAVGYGFAFGAPFGVLSYFAVQHYMPVWRRRVEAAAADGAGEGGGGERTVLEGGGRGGAAGGRGDTLRDTALLLDAMSTAWDGARAESYGVADPVDPRLRGCTAPAMLLRAGKQGAYAGGADASAPRLPPIAGPAAGAGAGAEAGAGGLSVPLMSDADADDAAAAPVPEEQLREHALVEQLFRPLNVLTAAFESFAHGANDVANSIGPFNAVVGAYQQPLGGKLGMPEWVLCIGGVGIVVGLWTYGERVMRTMGKDITYVTPSRAFCIELAATFTILFATNLGLPVSTTHASVGAVIGIGVVDGASKVNWGVLKGVFLSWIITLPAAAFTTAAIFGFLLPAVTSVCAAVGSD